MTLPARFEHIAIAVDLDDLAAWDRLLRGGLGGVLGGNLDDRLPPHAAELVRAGAA